MSEEATAEKLSAYRKQYARAKDLAREPQAARFMLAIALSFLSAEQVAYVVQAELEVMDRLSELEAPTITGE